MTRSSREIKKKLRIVRFGAIVLALIIIGFAAILLLSGGEEELPPVNGNGNGEIPYEHYNETVNETEEPPENITEVCDEECLLEKAMMEKDPKYCDWMLNASAALACYEKIAFDNFDACLKVENRSLLYDCIVAEANRTGDISVCDYLIQEDEALSCRQTFDPCYYYSGTEMRICLALSHEDVSYCESDNKCILNYSLETENSSMCEDISLAAERQACRSYFAGTDMCADLGVQAERYYCWQLYAILSDNKLICTQIETVDGPYALDCFSYFAAKTEDLSFCRQGPLELNDLWDCYISYSLTTGDLEGCDSIDRLASTHMFECYYEYAKKYGNPHACDLMGDPRYAKTCYVGSIMNNTNLNFTYCSDIDQEIWKNKCYTESAKVYEDISICDYIEPELEREICIDSYHTFINGKSD
jgi:hypothetical protein